MRKPLHRLQFVVVNLLVLATGGLLAFSCNEPLWTGPTDTHESPSGFYVGTFTSTDVQPAPARDTVGMISEEFDAHFLLADQHYAGIVAVNTINLSGSMIEYRGRQSVFFGFEGASSITLDGEVEERNGMFGTYEGDEAEGRFALTYNVAYEEGSALESLAGLWSYNESSSGGAVYSITLGIEDTGELFGSDTAGCNFSGQVSIIDDRYSVYRAAISVSECGDVNGDYTGLVFYPGAGAMDVLYFGTQNGQYALARQLSRL